MVETLGYLMAEKCQDLIFLRGSGRGHRPRVHIRSGICRRLQRKYAFRIFSRWKDVPSLHLPASSWAAGVPLLRVHSSTPWCHPQEQLRRCSNDTDAECKNHRRLYLPTGDRWRHMGSSCYVLLLPARWPRRVTMAPSVGHRKRGKKLQLMFRLHRHDTPSLSLLRRRRDLDTGDDETTATSSSDHRRVGDLPRLLLLLLLVVKTGGSCVECMHGAGNDS